MVYVLASSVLVFVLTNSMPNFWRMGLEMVQKGEAEENRMLFLAAFEEEFNRAQGNPHMDKTDLTNLRFRIDWDLDGTTEGASESREFFSYFFDKGKSRLARKVRSRSYEALGRIESFVWQPSKQLENCYEWKIRSQVDTEDFGLVFCR